MYGTQPAAESGVYVYCVTRAEPYEDGHSQFAAEGIGGRGDPVRVLCLDGLAAVVSDAPKIRYTLRREYLEAHERVVEEAMTYADVLPVSFGSVADTDRQVLEKLLRQRFDDLHDYLAYVQGRVEMGLRVHWNRERLFADIVAENNDIRALRENIAGLDPDAAYYDRVQLGEMTEAAIAAKREDTAQSIMAHLSPLAVDTRVNDPLTDMMVLNAAFLVDRTQEAAFDGQVRALGEAEVGRLILQYVGPVPPYNFVTLQVRW
jgi:hypothetical protein